MASTVAVPSATAQHKNCSQINPRSITLPSQCRWKACPDSQPIAGKEKREGMAHRKTDEALQDFNIITNSYNIYNVFWGAMASRGRLSRMLR